MENRRVKSQIEAAAELGVTPKTLRAWRVAAWWQSDFRNDDGYDIEAIVAANPRESLREENNEMNAEMHRMNLEEQGLRLKLIQMRIDEKSGNLVPLKDVIAAISQADEGLVATILDLPYRAARLLPEGKARTEFIDQTDSICRDALRKCGAHLKQRFQEMGVMLKPSE